jgi:hypothetical protein
MKCPECDGHGTVDAPAPGCFHGSWGRCPCGTIDERCAECGGLGTVHTDHDLEENNPTEETARVPVRAVLASRADGVVAAEMPKTGSHPCTSPLAVVKENPSALSARRLR